MRIGFAKTDVTPRVGVELTGFGAFINRHSIAVRDRLWSRAMALSKNGRTVVLVSNDLLYLPRHITARVRELVTEATGIPSDAIMVHSIHTHSGPNTVPTSGWGEIDPPYVEVLPGRIADACIRAVENLRDAMLSHAEVPCEGIGLNREYDIDAPPLDDVLNEDWRPAKPELTDITCHVLVARAGDEIIGFASYFGCHPVVCCAQTRYIHGDYAGVATNLLEREHPGSVGLFLQGAQGDVNSCVVHKPENDSLLALDVIAGRYARSVRAGIKAAAPVDADEIAWAQHAVTFSRREMTIADFRNTLSEQEAILRNPGASDADAAVRMATVNALAFRKLIAAVERGETLKPPAWVQGLRIGPIAFLGAPFEIFQAIKNDVKAAAKSPVPLVMGFANEIMGYAPDHTAAARGGYAADVVPLIHGILPFSNIHDELVQALLDVEADLY